MRRDTIPYVLVKGFALALAAWKALALALLLNVLMAFAVARPVESALAQALDRNPMGSAMAQGADPTFFTHFQRKHPDVLGGIGVWESLVTGERAQGLLSAGGAAGTLAWLALLSALLTSVLAGGFAGRFGAERDRGSLAAFGQDCGRFAISSLVLGIVSLLGIVAAYQLLFVLPGTLYDARELTTERDATLLLLGRLGAFLLGAGAVRLVVTYARAAIGITRRGSPFRALAAGATFVARRPFATLTLEVAFGACGLLPLVVWGLVGPVWGGSSPLTLALVVALQQGVLLLRMGSRVAYLGAACGLMRASAEAAYPAAEKIDPARMPVVARATGSGPP